MNLTRVAIQACFSSTKRLLLRQRQPDIPVADKSLNGKSNVYLEDGFKEPVAYLGALLAGSVYA